MSDTPPPPVADRLAKVMARAGLCSRRDAEGWIAAGRVTVNGKKVITPAFNVTNRDKITVDGEPLAERQGTRIWLYHKPAGLVVTEKDPEGRQTIFEALEEKGLPRVVTVGRLDINTEGLLLLTNDGGLKRVLELPSTGWLRRYRVRAYGYVTQAQLDALKDGITVDGINYGPIEATLEREQGHNVWIVVGLREGKNREVKNVLGALGLEVNRLIRVSYGPFQLGELQEGQIEMVKAKMLKDQLGKKLAEAANVDFDSEMPDLFAPPPRSREEAPRGRSPRGGQDGRRSFGRDEERPVRPRRVHFDEDGRAPEEYEPKSQGPARQRHDPDDQPASTYGKPQPRPERAPRADRAEGGKPSFGDRPQRGARSDGDRPQRSHGDKPGRSFGDKPGRSFGDKPGRSFGDKPGRSFGERPARAFSDRPERGPRSDRPQRSFDDARPARREDRPGQGRPQSGGRPSFGDRPQGGRPSSRPYGDRPQGGRPSFGDRPQGGARPSFGDRPQGGGRPSFGDRPQGARPSSRPYGDKPQGGRPSFGDRPQGGRPAGKSFGDKPQGARPSSRPYGDKPQGGRPSFGDRPQGGRPAGKSFGDRPQGGRPAGKSFGDRPQGGRPAGKSFGDRPQGGRPAGKSFGDRPQGGRPAGKSFGDRPQGGRPTGGRPGADRPSGGRPAGGRPTGGRPSGGPRKPRG